MIPASLKAGTTRLTSGRSDSIKTLEIRHFLVVPDSPVQCTAVRRITRVTIEQRRGAGGLRPGRTLGYRTAHRHGTEPTRMPSLGSEAGGRRGIVCLAPIIGTWFFGRAWS